MKFAKTLMVALSFLLATVSQANEISKSEPYSMIQQVADKTFTRFKNEQAAIKQSPNQLKTIVLEELVPYVDYKYAAYKVLGSNLKKTTKEQRSKFVPVFRDYLVTTYAQVFTLYNDQKVNFEPAKNIKAKTRIVAVKTTIVEPGRDPINLSFKVRRNKKTNEWKAFDMVAEGISLLDSKQKEVNSLIKKHGIDNVIEQLKKKADRNIIFDKKESKA